MILNIYDKITGKIIYRKNGENKNKYYYTYEDGKIILSDTYKLGYTDGRKEFYKNFDDNTMIISEIYVENAKIANNIPVMKTIEDLKIEGKHKLIEGEYVEEDKLYYIPYDTNLNYLKPKFDLSLKMWLDIEEEEIIKDEYVKIIDDLKLKIQEKGFLFKGKYAQKSRDKDIAFLLGRIKELEQKEIGALRQWQFGDGQENLVYYNINEFTELLQEGTKFNDNVFIVETILKMKTPNLAISLQDFEEELNKLT